MGGDNLHRNVLFRGNSSVANRTVPFSQFDSQNPEDLWRYLADFEKQTGAEVLAIPAQRQPEQRPHVHGGDLRRQAAHEGAGGDAGAVRADHRSHPDQGRQRSRIRSSRRTTSSPTTRSGTSPTSTAPRPRSPRCCKYEYAREALKNGLAAGAQARREPVQVRHGRQHRRAHRPWPRSKRRTSSASTPASSPGRIAGSTSSSRRPIPSSPSRAGSRRPPVMRASGRRRTRAKRSSTR